MCANHHLPRAIKKTQYKKYTRAQVEQKGWAALVNIVVKCESLYIYNKIYKW